MSKSKKCQKPTPRPKTYTNKILVCVTSDERQKWDAMAKGREMSLSSMIRAAVNNVTPQTVLQPIDTNRASDDFFNYVVSRVNKFGRMIRNFKLYGGEYSEAVNRVMHAEADFLEMAMDDFKTGQIQKYDTLWEQIEKL